MLPETRPKTFEIYLQWLHTGDLVLSDKYDLADIEDWDDTKKEHACYTYWRRLKRLVVFADMYGGNKFTNAIADLIPKASETLFQLPSEGLIETIYKKLPKSSPLRRMMVDLYYYDADEDALQSASVELPRQFLCDFMVRYKQLKDEDAIPDPPYETSLCAYHIHDEMAPKCKE